MDVFSTVVRLQTIERMLAQVPLFNYDVCNVKNKNKYVKIVIEQTCVLYYQWKNMKNKWQYFHEFHGGICPFFNVIDEQLFENDDLYQDKCDKHPLYSV